MKQSYPEPKEVVTTAVQPEYPKLTTAERARQRGKELGVLPFDPDRDLDKYRSDLFESDEELEAFITEIYEERLKHLA